jgi:hypothetical protein
MRGICKSVWQRTSRVPAMAWIILGIVIGFGVAEFVLSFPILPVIQVVAALLLIKWIIEVVWGLLIIATGLLAGLLGALLLLAASVIESFENLSHKNPNSNPKV